MKIPTQEKWDSWVLTLRTGDAVSVYYTATGDHIYDARVRVTKTGKVYLVTFLDGYPIRDGRRDWRHYRVNVLGGGERRIYKLRTS